MACSAAKRKRQLYRLLSNGFRVISLLVLIHQRVYFIKGFKDGSHLPEVGFNFDWEGPNKSKGSLVRVWAWVRNIPSRCWLLNKTRKELDLVRICTIVHIS